MVMGKLLRQSLTMLLLLTLITGVIYPLLVTGVAQLVFAPPANGSVVEHAGKPTGSSLIGQSFTGNQYFWGRPSATAPYAYATLPSGGANQGPNNPALIDAVKQRIETLRAADPQNAAPIPVDLVTASGSGIDPHISPAAANYQAPRIARERKLSAAQVQALIAQATEGRQFGVLGEPRVNVLKLNLLLDGRW
jgi:potassium-transporting ATPase KdpC subunit